MERKNSYCHFPIQNLKAKLPYIRTHIKIKLCPNYSIAPYPPPLPPVPKCIWNIIYGGKSIIIYYSLLYFMFICGLKLQHLKTHVKNE